MIIIIIILIKIIIMREREREREVRNSKVIASVGDLKPHNKVYLILSIIWGQSSSVG